MVQEINPAGRCQRSSHVTSGCAGKGSFRGRPETQDDLLWGTKPTTITKGVHVARTLTPVDQFDDLPVRLMNVHVNRVSSSQRSGTGHDR